MLYLIDMYVKSILIGSQMPKIIILKLHYFIGILCYRGSRVSNTRFGVVVYKSVTIQWEVKEI